MRQTLRQMRLLASHMNVSLHELARRRLMRSNVVACADDSGTLKFRGALFCDPALPDNFQILPRTLYR